MEFKEYSKYRWFFTKSKKLVVGGKSAIQNDDLLKSLKKNSIIDYVVMHTALPGSPFSVILEDPKKLSKQDLMETAIFTGCFSRAWRAKSSKTEIHQFNLSQLSKLKSMKAGSWNVSGNIKKHTVELMLFLTFQESKLRAVPKLTLNSNSQVLVELIPGKIDKSLLVSKLAVILPELKISQDEVLSAFPPGGTELIKTPKSNLIRK